MINKQTGFVSSAKLAALQRLLPDAAGLMFLLGVRKEENQVTSTACATLQALAQQSRLFPQWRRLN